MNTSAILLIEDEAILGKNISHFLQDHGHHVSQALTAEEGLAQLDTLRPDAVLLDFSLPGMDGLQALRQLQARDAGLPVLMLTGHGSVELAVEAMKCGATDFLTKPVSLARLKRVLDKALLQPWREPSSAAAPLRSLAHPHVPDAADGASAPATLPRLIGSSAPMQQLRASLAQMTEVETQQAGGNTISAADPLAGAAHAEPPAVLVLGETGTGKEQVARGLHANGPRRARPFIELNCAALPADRLLTELFGVDPSHAAASQSRPVGLIERADGGTLFLDEVGELPLELQAKLLRLMQDRTIRRIGGQRDVRVDVRVIAASHQPLEAMVRTGQFRADLYYRLSVVRLLIAPLRERGDDVIELSQAFLDELAQRYGRDVPTLADDAHAKLRAHTWPGNVRELRNVIEQALLLTRAPVLEARHLSTASIPGWVPPSPFESPRAAAQATAAALDGLQPGTASAELAASDATQACEREQLVQALERCQWNVTRTALSLKISRDALRYRIDKHGLKRETKFQLRD
ncbi:MAG: sigma-54-dependent transcriptional regulator [Leptothrix sp. (in: b-proteobacteria)]